MKAMLFVFALVFAMGLGLATQAHAAVSADSKYSSLEDKDCNLLRSSNDDENPEIDYFRSVCPGNDGYLVKFLGGDIRSWVGILKPGEKYDEAADFYQPLMEGAKGQFPNVEGNKLEWRYNDGKLVAFILRMIAQDAEDVDKDVENLVVIRVPSDDFSKACLIGSVDTKTVANSNVEARKIADDAIKVCP